MTTPRNSGGKTGPDYFISWDSNSVFLSLEETTDQERAPLWAFGNYFWLGLPVDACNPSPWDHHELDACLGYTEKPCLKQINQKKCCKPDIEVYNLRMRRRQKDHAFKVRPNYVVSERLPQNKRNNQISPGLLNGTFLNGHYQCFFRSFVPLYR